jgi:hypothetical protein
LLKRHPFAIRARGCCALFVLILVALRFVVLCGATVFPLHFSDQADVVTLLPCQWINSHAYVFNPRASGLLSFLPGLSSQCVRLDAGQPLIVYLYSSRTLLGLSFGDGSSSGEASCFNGLHSFSNTVAEATGDASVGHVDMLSSRELFESSWTCSTAPTRGLLSVDWSGFVRCKGWLSQWCFQVVKGL